MCVCLCLCVWVGGFPLPKHTHAHAMVCVCVCAPPPTAHHPPHATRTHELDEGCKIPKTLNPKPYYY